MVALESWHRKELGASEMPGFIQNFELHPFAELGLRQFHLQIPRLPPLNNAEGVVLIFLCSASQAETSLTRCKVKGAIMVVLRLFSAPHRERGAER